MDDAEVKNLFKNATEEELKYQTSYEFMGDLWRYDLISN